MPPCWLAFRFLPDWFADGHHSWHSDGLLGIQFFRIPRQISWDESTARMHWVIQPFKLRFSRWPRRNFQRCHGKFNILEGFKMLQDLLGIERRLEASGWFLFFWGLVILPWSFMGDLHGFATFYRYGWVNRRDSSVNRHVCLGIPKGLGSHCFIESMMCIPVSIRDTPISIDANIYIYIYLELYRLYHYSCNVH